MGEIASPSQLRMSFIRWALVTVPLILLLGTASGLLSDSGNGNAWYAALAKPSILPPPIAFPVAWTILYILLGLALAYVLQARGARGRRPAIAMFALQFVLNLAWSPVFFGAHKIVPALGLIGAIFVSAAIAALLIARIRPIAAVLMLPYLGWLIFAGFLNYEVMRLNPDAETVAPAAPGTQISL